jgi:Zn-dependent protease
MALDQYHYYLLFIPQMLLSLSVHESSHAYSAYRAGDDTAALQGRISLNPFRHLDPWGLVFFLVFKFGWAKPCPVAPYRLKNPRRDEILISLAGPGSNLILALLFSLILRSSWQSLAGLGEAGKMVLLFLAIGAQINTALAFFNVLPIPPLDGSHVLAGILPLRYQPGFQRIMPYGMLILLGLVMLGSFAHLDVFGLLIGVPMTLWLWLVMGSELLNFVVTQAPYL